MSDALTPLRHAYGVEPAGPEPATGEPGHAELTLLRQMREALDALPELRPEADVVTAVLAQADPLAAVRSAYDPETEVASVEGALLRSTAEVLDRAVHLGDRSPHPDAVSAVLARAAEADAVSDEPRLGADAAAVEATVLDQSLDALDRLALDRPDADVVARVLAHAEAAHPLAAVRHLYADGPAPLTEAGAVEAEVLRQSGTIFDRAARSRPQPRPSDAVATAILARAAEASSLASEPALLESTTPVEAAMLSQSLAALDRLPTARPAAATVGAVLARAAEAGPSPTSTRRAPDRTPARPARQRRLGAWAGVGGLLVAALVAIVALPSLLTSEPALAPEAAALVSADAAPSPEADGDIAEDAPLAEAEPPPVPTSNAAPGLAGTAALTAAVPPVVPNPPASGPSMPPAASAARFAARTTADAAPARVESVPSWDAGDDVRTLSLRLQELDRETQGLAWDAPINVGGAPASLSPTSTPGIQAVREGAAPLPVAPDSTRQ